MVESLTQRLNIGVTPLAGNIGAEISGVNIGGSLADEAVAWLREAILKYKVVFLRDQHLDYSRHVAFAQRLGPLTLGHPFLEPPPGQGYLYVLDSAERPRTNLWHVDMSYLARPPAFEVLRAVVIPPVGGDTMWANTMTAYESLPTELRDVADHLRMIHRRIYRNGPTYEAEQPAVCVHPETGGRSLLIGTASSIVGFGPQASLDLIRVLHEFVTRPEHTVRWRWQAGDLAIWDNRATEHYALLDYGTAHRRTERLTVGGSAPVGVDGRPGIAIGEEPLDYYAGADR